MCLKLVRLRYVLITTYFPREGFRLSERNVGFRPFREAFIQRPWKQSESLVLRVVLYEEFLHTKINNKDVYVDYGATEDIPDDACNSSSMDGNLTALNWSRWLKFQKLSIRKYHFFAVKTACWFWLVYFSSFLVLTGTQDLILVFPPISQLATCRV